MARDRTARIRIRNHLLQHGAVDDPSGHSTSVLKDAIGYEGSSVAFIQLIAAMDHDGEIVREIRGKRTYRISPGPELQQLSSYPTSPTGLVARLDGGQVGAATGATDGTAVVIDYDKLARALVRELWEFVTLRPSGDQLTAPAAALEAERDRMLAERDDFARRLELARVKLDELLGGPALVDALPEDATTSA